jgi:hypothetical protein
LVEDEKKYLFLLQAAKHLDYIKKLHSHAICSLLNKTANKKPTVVGVDNVYFPKMKYSPRL